MRTITFATTDAPRGSGLVTALTSVEHQRGDSVLIATVQEIMPSVGLIQLNYLGISCTILRLVGRVPIALGQGMRSDQRPSFGDELQCAP
jgi:hypothetical protein